MIQLTDTEKKLIKLCKSHYREQFPYAGSWAKTIKPMFIEIYGWDPDKDNNYDDYLNCIFNKLFDIHLKIVDDNSGTNNQLKSVLNASFRKSISRIEELPIERAIAELCGIIQNNKVIDNGVARYEID